MTSQQEDGNKNEDRTVPPDADWNPEEDIGESLVDVEPSEDLGPETGPRGTDPESNVPGRAKPASEGVEATTNDSDNA